MNSIHCNKSDSNAHYKLIFAIILLISSPQQFKHRDDDGGNNFSWFSYTELLFFTDKLISEAHICIENFFIQLEAALNAIHKIIIKLFEWVRYSCIIM